MPYQGVSFDDDRQRHSSVIITQQRTPPGMMGWFIKHRIVQNESQAKLVLLVFSIAVFVLSGIIFWINSGIGGGGRGVVDTPESPLSGTPTLLK